MKLSYLLTGTIIVAASILSMKAYAADTAKEFVEKATIGGKFEIDSSKLALEKSKNTDVRSFAQKMIDDHTQANEKLTAALPKAGVKASDVPTTLDEKHQKKLDKLREAKAEDFDKDYVDAQEDAHDEAVSLFKDYAKDGDNVVLKDFASTTLPTLQDHHDKVDALKDNKTIK